MNYCGLIYVFLRIILSEFLLYTELATLILNGYVIFPVLKTLLITKSVYDDERNDK